MPWTPLQEEYALQKQKTLPLEVADTNKELGEDKKEESQEDQFHKTRQGKSLPALIAEKQVTLKEIVISHYKGTHTNINKDPHTPDKG
jgi:hypothetical protein